MSQLEAQMRHRDREMVPRILIRAMFILMLTALAIVSYAQLTGTPNVGQVRQSPVVAERSLVFDGDRNTIIAVSDADGTYLARSDDEKMGFIGVIGRVIERERMRHGHTATTDPVTLVRRENGNLALMDPLTGWSAELIGYGKDNVAAFAGLLD